MTFLVTRKMSPELAARVRASVRGRRARQGTKRAPRTVALVRLGIAGVLVAAISSLLLLRRQVNDELDGQRAALLEEIRQQSARISADDRHMLERARLWLTRSAQGYPGDFIAPRLRSDEDLRSILARPTLYVRGRLDDFRSSEGIDESAEASTKDAFVLCWLEPPASRSEKTILGRTRTAYAGGARMNQATAHVERLHAAFVILPLLEPAWEARVQHAEGRRDLLYLQRELERAPFEAATRALKARQLLFLMDEPGDTSGPTELDGERPHAVRIGLIDLAGDEPLLRLRRRVDPNWISEATRAEYARGMDSCALALDARAALRDGCPTNGSTGGSGDCATSAEEGTR